MSASVWLDTGVKLQSDKGNDRYKAVIKRLAIFVGATNMPNSLVENSDF